jgi:hypothetical protein
VKLPSLNMAPFATQQLQIGAMQKQLGIPNDAHWALVTLTSSTAPNDVIAIASSYDASGRYSLETPFSSVVGGHFAGGEWRVDAEHNQLMAVTNSGQKSTNALLTLHYDNGRKSYEMEQAIQPGDQMWVNMASLIRDRVPDRKGNILPSDTSFGTYDLRDLSLGLGSLMPGGLALDGTFGFRGAPPPYPPCCGTSSPDWGVDSFDLSVDDVSLDPIYATDSCNGDSENISGSFSDWWSGNTSIATVTNKAVTGVSAGTTTANASGVIFLDGCFEDPVQLSNPVSVAPTITSFDPNPIMIGVSNTTLTINGSGFGSLPTVTLPSGITFTGQGSTASQIILTGVSVALSATVGNNNVTVTADSVPSPPAALTIDGPYHMVVQSDVTGLCSGCKTTPMRTVTYQVQNFSGTPANQTWMGENISVTGWSCTQSNPGFKSAPCSSNFNTNAAGIFSDQWSLGADGYTPTGCGDNVTDHWQWCAHNSAQTLGTLTGYGHTNAVSINGIVSPNGMAPGTVVPF